MLSYWNVFSLILVLKQLTSLHSADVPPTVHRRSANVPPTFRRRSTDGLLTVYWQFADIPPTFRRRSADLPHLDSFRPINLFFVENFFDTELKKNKIINDKILPWSRFMNKLILNSQYIWKWTNANPMKILGQLASYPKLLIGSKLSLG